MTIPVQSGQVFPDRPIPDDQHPALLYLARLGQGSRRTMTEALEKIEAGTDLSLNVAPAGCMVATMGGVMHPLILHHASKPAAQMESMLAQNGEVDRETIEFALLKQMGPARYYGS